MAHRSWITIAASLVSLATASWPDPPLSGHDFDFTAEFKGAQDGTHKEPPKSGDILKFSTSKRPAPDDIIQASPLLYDMAAITLLDPDDEARKARYIAFFEVAYIPTIDTLDNVIYSYPWIESNLTVQDSGALATSNDSDSAHAASPEIDGSEVRNATIQVWRQNDDLLKYIDSVEHGRVPMPLLFAIAEIFSNTTSKVSYDFKRASIDFKIQNKTGEARCDINSNGAPIPSVSRGATACLASATTAAHSGGSSATASPTSKSKHNAAVSVMGSPMYGFLAMVVAGVWIL